MTEKEIVLRIRRSQRVGVLIFAIVVPMILIGMVVFMKPSSVTVAENVRDLFSTGFGAYIMFSALFLTAMMTYMALQTWHDRLIFTDARIERRGVPHPTMYKGPTRYEDIVSVRRGSAGMLILETSQGKKFIIAPKSFDGGPSSVIDQLKAHIAQERFEENLEEKLYRRSKVEKVALVIGAMGILILVGGFFYEGVFEKIRKDVAWHLEVKGSLSENIESYALSEDGSLWALIRKRMGDFNDPASYEVRHLISGNEEFLSIPSMQVLYPDGPPEIGFTYPVGILLTKGGSPGLYFDSLQPELMWTGSSWEWGQQPNIRETYIEQLARVTGDPYWETLNDHGKILVMDTKSGMEREVDLGPSEDPYRVNYHGTPEGWTIVQMDGEPRRYFLLRFREPDEPKIWVEIDYSTLPLSEYWNLMDYTVNADGVFFVLIHNIPYCMEGTATDFVGKLDPSGGDWTWRTLQHPDLCDNPEGGRQVLVDVRGRVWLTGEDIVVAYEPGVFESGGIEKTDYVLYSEYNSGYYGGFSLRVGPDERIWTLDTLGDALVWIDPDVDELEQPLPDWIHELLGSPIFKFTMNYGGLILIVIALLMFYSSIALGVSKRRKMNK